MATRKTTATKKTSAAKTTAKAAEKAVAEKAVAEKAAEVKEAVAETVAEVKTAAAKKTTEAKEAVKKTAEKVTKKAADVTITVEFAGRQAVITDIAAKAEAAYKAMRERCLLCRKRRRLCRFPHRALISYAVLTQNSRGCNREMHAQSETEYLLFSGRRCPPCPSVNIAAERVSSLSAVFLSLSFFPFIFNIP